MAEWLEESYIQTFIQVTTWMLIAGFVIFGVWALALKQRNSKRWKEMGLLALFALVGAGMVPLVNKFAYSLSFVERLGIVTLIWILYAGYKYYAEHKRK